VRTCAHSHKLYCRQIYPTVKILHCVQP